MRKYLSTLLFVMFFLTLLVTSSIAGSRHYSSGYGNYYRRSFMPYSPYYQGQYYHANHVWTHLGVGLLTGAVIGAALYQPPKQRMIIYGSPAPMIISTHPYILNRTFLPPSPQALPPQTILRRVITTPEVLNIRSGPGLDTPIVDQIKQSTILDVLGTAPEWLFIRTGTGQHGWVMAIYTRQTQDPAG